jgi:hypothetical protein
MERGHSTCSYRVLQPVESLQHRSGVLNMECNHPPGEHAMCRSKHRLDASAPGCLARIAPPPAGIALADDLIRHLATGKWHLIDGPSFVVWRWRYQSHFPKGHAPNRLNPRDIRGRISPLRDTAMQSLLWPGDPRLLFTSNFGVAAIMSARWAPCLLLCRGLLSRRSWHFP